MGDRWPYTVELSTFNYGGPKILKVGHMTPSRPVNRGRQQPRIWIPQPWFAYSLYNFHGAMMMIKGNL